ncbi:hypothetical protein JYT16_01635 [Gemmatimonas aurantiaca]|nr:hypothetical protein [Gemmatimonas aurantiaca]
MKKRLQTSITSLIALIILSTATVVTNVSARDGIDGGKIQKMLKAADTTSALNQLNAAAGETDHLTHYWLGRISYARYDWAAAKASFQKSVDIKNKFHQALYWLSLSQMHLAEFDEAAANIRKGSKKARTMRIEFKGAEDSLELLKVEYAKKGTLPGMGGVGENNGSASNAGAATMSAPSEEDLKSKVRSFPKEPLNYFVLGKFYYDSDRFVEAREQFVGGLKQDKNHNLCSYYLGLTMVQAGELNEAEKLFEKRLKRGKGLMAEFNNGLGLVFLTRARNLTERDEARDAIFEQASKADGQFRAAIAFDNENCTFHLNLAEANYLRGVFPSAKAEYEIALAMCPGETDVSFRFAEACFKMRDYVCALEQVQIAISSDSANPAAWEMFGTISFGAASGATTSADAVAKYKNAIAAFRKFVILTGGKADSTNANAFYQLATALSILGGHEEALANYQAVLDVPVVPREIYYSMAKAAGGLKQWDEALGFLEKHENWARDAGESYKPSMSAVAIAERKGEAYYGKKDYLSAAPYLQQAYNADTTKTKLLVNLCLAHHNVKEYRNALPYYERLLAQDLGDQMWSLYLNGAFCALAIANGDAGDEEEDLDEMDGMDEGEIDSATLDDRSPSDYYSLTVEWLNRVLEYKPDNERAINLLATTYLYDMNDCANGVKWYKKVREIKPDDCQALRSLGYAYFGGICTINFGKAISYLGQALDCFGGDACSSVEISMWIAQAYHLRAADKAENDQKSEAKADFKKAHEWYGKVLVCDPNNAEAADSKSAIEFEF